MVSSNARAGVIRNDRKYNLIRPFWVEVVMEIEL